MRLINLIYILTILNMTFLNSPRKDLIKQERLHNINYPQNIIEKDSKDFSKLDKRYNFSEKELLKFNLWIDSTLKDSKRNQKSAIIVDKSEYKLYLINNGEIIKKYPIELGFNPFQDKLKKGDGCTPEGIYEIAEKKDQSLYYKALLLNYPNENDRKLGKTGSLIEIHGGGSGKPGNKGGYNWTLGCVSTSNQNINEIYKTMKKRELITIVRYNDSLN